MENKKLTEGELIPLISRAIDSFRDLCSKYDKINKTNKLNIVDNIIRTEGKSQFTSSKAIPNFARIIASFLNEETNEILTGIKNDDDKVSILTNAVATWFQNNAQKSKGNGLNESVDMVADFSKEYDEAVKNSINTLRKPEYQWVDDKGNPLDTNAIFSSDEELGLVQADGQINEFWGAVAKFALRLVGGCIVGNAITNTVKQSPAACSFVRGLCDTFPVASKVLDWFTFTDLEEITKQDKINKGEISPDEEGEATDNNGGTMDGEISDDDVADVDAVSGSESEEDITEDWFNPMPGDNTKVNDGPFDMIEIDDNGNVINYHRKG